MADLTNPNVKIQYRIKAITKFGEFNDAIYFSKIDFDNITLTALQTQVQERINNWVKLVEEQSKIIPAEPTQQELQARKAELEAELAIINSKLN